MIIVLVLLLVQKSFNLFHQFYKLFRSYTPQQYIIAFLLLYKMLDYGAAQYN